MHDAWIVRTIVASMFIAAAAVSPPPVFGALQKPSPSEVLSAAVERGRDLLAAFHTYTCWFPASTTADDSILVGGYFTRIVVDLRFTGYKKTSAR